MQAWPVFLDEAMLRKLAYSAAVLLGYGGVRYLLLNVLMRRLPADSPHLLGVRKVVSYLLITLATLWLFAVWMRRTGDLSMALGIMTAGLAFALQEVIGSIAGWATIVAGRPFKIGDRVETGGIRGDVVDVGILRTTLMETGNWLNGDHNTGRIVTVSNAFLFKEPLFNASAHLNFIWDEITVPVPHRADWARAMELMVTAVREHAEYMQLIPQAQAQRQEARRQLAVKMTPLEPRSFLKITDNWVEIGVVYPVDVERRRGFRSEVSARLLGAFAEEGIEIASQTIELVRPPPVR